MKLFHLKIIFLLFISTTVFCNYLPAQSLVDLSEFKKNGATIAQDKQLITVSWPAGINRTARITLDLDNGNPLFKNIQLGTGTKYTGIAENIDPVFLLTIGKRTLSP